MSCLQVFRACRVLGAAMVGPTILVGVALALGGCEGVPRDTASTPPPPRQPIATSDDQYPAPRSERDTRTPPAPAR
ncbi:hypothetical protein LMG26411_05685 [Cupriavidus numazuensis]|uniref:Lipoprotein n=1 Tax=Cupriavidus numazuensis TaxID=221992 RepID=A0ABM8TPZ7_9BURK|nr:hypothetical protein LMG26411_05685 [Cupriavidus numazuensis]